MNVQKTFSIEYDKALRLEKMIDLTMKEVSGGKKKCTQGNALMFLVRNGYQMLLQEVEDRKLKAIQREKKVKGDPK